MTDGDRGARRARFVALSFLGAALIAGVLQFAAAAKVAGGARSLELIEGARLAESQGVAARVGVDDFDWLIAPASLGEGGVLLDFAIAGAEFLVVVLLLLLHRGRTVWLLVPVMFGGLFGYALNRMLNDQPCGCFGALWQPPEGFTLALDAAFVALGLGIAALRGAGKGALVGALVLSLGAAGGGFWYSGATLPGPDQQRATEPAEPLVHGTDPEPEPLGDWAPPAGWADLDGPEALLATPLLADEVRRGEEEGVAFYVFVWDPTCPTCDMMQPIVEMQREELEAEGNPILQVRSFLKGDLADDPGIEDWKWPTSPTVIVFRGAELLSVGGGSEALFPRDVESMILGGEPLPTLE